MAQVTDRNIGANPTGFAMRTEINNIIAALESDNSGSSEPLNTVAYMKWLDTSNATYYYVKERNHDNTAWVTLFRYTVATKIMEAVSNGVVLDDSKVVHKTGNETKAGVLTLTDGLKLQGQNVSPFSGFKNYIINGNFDVWQRGTSFTGLTNGTYSADRWVVYDSVGNVNYNVVRNTGVFTGGYGAQYTWNSGTGIRSVIQFIENVTKFKVGSQVTISFEAYTTSTPYTIGVAIQGVRGTWASATPAVTASVAITNTKTKYSVTLSVPDWTSLGIDWAHLEDTKLACKFDLGADTNGKNFVISNVQLEEGSVATPFENRPYGLELSLCQRYYEVINNIYRLHTVYGCDTTGAYAVERHCTVPFAVQKRTDYANYSSGITYTGNGIGINGGSRDSISFVTLGGSTNILIYTVTSIKINAEL